MGDNHGQGRGDVLTPPALWLQQQENQPAAVTRTPGATVPSMAKEKIPQTVKMDTTGGYATSSGAAKPSADSDPELKQILQMLTSAVVELKEDMQDLKSERPRKGQRSEVSNETSESFELMPQ